MWQAGQARPQGCPALEFCLFEGRGEKWVNRYPAAALGFRIELPKRCRLPHPEPCGSGWGMGGPPQKAGLRLLLQLLQSEQRSARPMH